VVLIFDPKKGISGVCGKPGNRLIQWENGQQARI
jgi:hypothetical protein